MRRILVENARRRKSLKRGGNLDRQDLAASQLMAPESCDNLIALDEALDLLATEDPRLGGIGETSLFRRADRASGGRSSRRFAA